MMAVSSPSRGPPPLPRPPPLPLLLGLVGEAILITCLSTVYLAWHAVLTDSNLASIIAICRLINNN
jgi:hypothetical protein